jgi:hypothetical protein
MNGIILELKRKEMKRMEIDDTTNAGLVDEDQD